MSREPIIIPNDLLYLVDSKKSRVLLQYSIDRLYESVEFFLKTRLQKYKHEDVLPLQIDLKTAMECSMKANGRFTTLENLTIIHINPLSILDQVSQNLLFKSKRKSLFYVLLHEVYHYLTFLDSYIKNAKERTAEEYQEMLLLSHAQKFEEFQGDIRFTQWQANLPEEYQADIFALDNLANFENMYAFQGVFAGYNIPFGRIE